MDIDYLSSLLRYDKESGMLYWKVRKGKVTAGSAVTHKDKHGYVVVTVDGRKLFAHRVAFALVNGRWPHGEIDHINTTKHDNRWVNIRDVDRSSNQQNRHVANRLSKTGVLGVSPYGRKFVANIMANGRLVYLGSFDSIEEGRAAYLSAKQKLHIQGGSYGNGNPIG